MAEVGLTEDAVEDLEDLEQSARRTVIKALAKLATEPDKRGQPLGRRSTSNLTTFRKLVVGNRDIHIIYQVRDNGDVVVVWVIGPRADNEAYELAKARLLMHPNPAIANLATSLEEIWKG